MGVEKDRKRLTQDRNLEWIGRDLKATDMVTVYRWNSEKVRGDYFILGGLIPPNLVKKILYEGQHISSVIENVWPEPAAYCPPGESRVKYFRWGVEENMYGTEPLIIVRQFSNMKENYFEISEEFRLFHNLYHDRKTDKYIKINDAGNEETIVIVKPDEVQIRLKEIRQFLAIKEMYLSMLFEFNEYSRFSLEELGLSEIRRDELKRDGLMCWVYDLLNTPNQEFLSDSRLRGRRLIEPLSKSKSGFGDFANEPKQYAEFIVDVDENEDPVYHTCDPRKLGDYPGENSDTAWKLSIVHFRKQVLDKYYNESSKYTVRDSMVSCGLWSMKIDNHHSSDKVCVYLDHLGIHLPHEEQLHWRVYNIPPEGGVSETFFRRNVLGEWASSDQPEHLFKQNYEQLRKACEECLGRQLLKPLDSGDGYRIQRLRNLTVDEESHFKDSVLDLANILIERLNEEHLKDLIPVNMHEKNKRGINRLEYVLNSQEVEEAEKHIIFLRCLWDLRITRGGSHPELLEDSRYKRASAHFDLENLNRQKAFAKILGEAVEFLDFLISVVRSGKLNDPNNEDSEKTD